MTREEYFNSCLDAISNTRCLLMEATTGFGKSYLSIKLSNNLCDTRYKGKKTKMLLLVAKRVHKVTWKKEFEKWGGIKVDEVVMECYESLHKHLNETFDIVVLDECHHIGSEARMEYLSTIHYDYMFGLSATIPRKVKQYFKYNYHSKVISCNISEAIEDEVLPEPQILLMPLELDNTKYTEEIEINPKAKGPIVYGTYNDVWKYRKSKTHAILKCTKKQRSNEYNSEVLHWKNVFTKTRSEATKQIWLHKGGQRLEYYSTIKIPVLQEILKHLDNQRTITFCKTIAQCEQLGEHCIHSKDKNADKNYEDFNEKKIDHITAVNILNENANLVDCKYAIFDNLSSSEVTIPQRLGRAMRHKSPVIIIPYYETTREQEIIEKMLEGFNKDYIKTIHSIKEIV